MATLLSDAFTRADSAVSPGSPTVGGPYTAAIGTWGIIGNQLYTAAATANSTLTFPGAVDVDFTCTVSNMTGVPNPGLQIRRVDLNNYWALTVSSTTTVLLQRNYAGTATARSPQIPIVMPAVLRIAALGPVIRVFVGGVLVAAVEDEGWQTAGTLCAFRNNASTNTTIRFDDVTVIDTAAFSSMAGSSNADTGFGSAGVHTPAHVAKGMDKKALDTLVAA